MGLRINNNLASLNASLNLGRANSMLSKSLARLSTGLKINNASDGPADLIISEKFRAQINSISKATENTQNAISMLSTAEGALNEVNSLLTKMKGLALKATQTGTQDPDEIAASQAEIDAALASIDSIARNTSFGSKFLLDGSLDIETGEVNTDNITVAIERAVFAGDSKRLNVGVIAAAQKAENSFDLNSSGTLTSAQTLKVTGGRGSSTITFASGAAGADIAKEINDQTTQTGVTATFDSTNNKVVLNSAEFGETEFVTVEDVDGTNDILRAELEEQTTSAFAEYGKQFKIVAKNSGEAGENISFMVNEETTSSTGSIAITKDDATGKVTFAFTLQDDGNLLFSTVAAVGDNEVDKDVTTTLSDLKTLIESNSTLNDLVEFKLQDGATLTDKVTIDSSYTKEFVKLNGAASGEAAVAATTTLGGSNTGAEITITAKTAGSGGNNVRIVFGDGDDLYSAADDTKGSGFTGATDYFSATSGTTQVLLGGTDEVIYVNRLATFQQIQQSIENDSQLSSILSVSYTGESSSTISDTTKVVALEGGKGITGGEKATAFIDITSGTAGNGVKVTAKKSGTDGNQVELILRNRGALNAGTVDVSGNQVIVNLSAANGNTTRYAALFSTANARGLGIESKYGANFFNQFDIQAVSDASLAANQVNISYDTTNKRITFTMNFGTATASALSTAITNASDIIVDTDTNLAFSDAFSIYYANGVDSVSVIVTPGSGVNGAESTSLLTGYFSASFTSTRLGEDGAVTTSANGLIALIRGNAVARELVDIDMYGTGTTNLSAIFSTAAVALSTGVTNNTIDGSQQVWGDFRYVLTGGVDGDVQTNIVRKTGIDGQVKVNGVEASAQNLAFTFDNGDVRGTVTLNESYNQTGNESSFTIKSKGAFFQIGQKAQLSYQAGIALRNISSNSIGLGQYFNPDFDTSIAESTTNQRKVVGTLADIGSGAKFDLAKNSTTAVDIIEKAIKDISTLRGKVGAFISNTLESNINSLGVAFENLTAAESRIRDVDFAAETAEFTRAQILVQAGTSIAAQANVATQAALQLLG